MCVKKLSFDQLYDHQASPPRDVSSKTGGTRFGGWGMPFENVLRNFTPSAVILFQSLHQWIEDNL